jgi:SAM-dependent methyltransferase
MPAECCSGSERKEEREGVATDRPAGDEGRETLPFDHHRLRDEVSRTYAEALARGTCCSGLSQPKGSAAKLAGYDPALLGDLPAEALADSFGCGNPLAFAGLTPGSTVVDLGSGAGLDLLIAARVVGPEGRVIGVDMTDEMIAQATTNAEKAGLTNIEVRKGLIEALPVEDESVDLIVSNCVINLSPEKNRVFAEIARVLRPGGRIRISDIVAENLPQWARNIAPLYCSCIGGAISEADYVAGLESAGLVDVEVVERITYDAAQISAIAGLDDSLSPATVVSDCCGQRPTDTFAPALAGKVWSAMFVGRKP